MYEGRFYVKLGLDSCPNAEWHMPARTSRPGHCTVREDRLIPGAGKMGKMEIVAVVVH